MKHRNAVAESAAITITPFDKLVRQAMVQATPDEARLAKLLYGIGNRDNHQAFIGVPVPTAPIYAIIARNLLRNPESFQAVIVELERIRDQSVSL